MVACARVDRFSNSLYSRTFVWRVWWVWTGDVVMWTTDDVPVCFSSHSLACLKECHCVKHAPTSAGTLPHPANAPAVLLLASASIPGSRSRTEIDDLSANAPFAPTVAYLLLPCCSPSHPLWAPFILAQTSRPSSAVFFLFARVSPLSEHPLL